MPKWFELLQEDWQFTCISDCDVRNTFYQATCFLSARGFDLILCWYCDYDKYRKSLPGRLATLREKVCRNRKIEAILVSSPNLPPCMWLDKEICQIVLRWFPCGWASCVTVVWNDEMMIILSEFQTLPDQAARSDRLRRIPWSEPTLAVAMSRILWLWVQRKQIRRMYIK